MKKVLIVALIALLMCGLATATSIDNTWSGSGTVVIDAQADDDQATHFETGGGEIEGEWHLTDANNNPYNYGVDTVTNWKKASVTNGYISSWTERTDSKASMYGSAGQYTESGVMASDGTASFAMKTDSNFASMKNCNYGFQSSDQFTADADNFDVYHTVQDGSGDGARAEVLGSGTADVDIMSSEMYGSSFSLGTGCGCYDNCDAGMTGTGTFLVNAWADNEIMTNDWTIPGDGTDNSATYNLDIGYAGSFNHPDFSVSGN